MKSATCSCDVPVRSRIPPKAGPADARAPPRRRFASGRTRALPAETVAESGAELRDLGLFAARLPALRAVAFNGKTAALHGRRQLSARPDLTFIDLPSTSGAYASLSREAKRQHWMTLRDHLA